MRPHGKNARVDPHDPQAFAQCDRCSFWFNRSDLSWQIEWGGVNLYNKQVLVCKSCYDKPQMQFKTIILPPDPPPVINARPPNFAYEEYVVLIAQHAIPSLPYSTQVERPPWQAGPQLLLCDQEGSTPLIAQYTNSTDF